MNATSASKRPLCVDLDGTLIATDALWESLLLLAKRQPLSVPFVFVWSLSGRARLKRQIADRVLPNAQALPYRAEVLELIENARADERPVLLVTASDQQIADAVAQHLGVFDEAIGSNGQSNLKGQNKREFLEERYGAGGFDYVGDSPADVPVWKAAKEGHAVGGRTKALPNVQPVSPPTEAAPPSKLKACLRALRPHQWAKNVLLFVAAILAHKIRHVPTLLTLVVAFACFSACASTVYIINDLLDLEQDRLHPTKRNRPFASGTLSIPAGLALASIVAPLGLLVAYFYVGSSFAYVLAGYLVITTAYSLYLKRKLIVDVITLGVLFTYRITAGGVAADVPVSFWLLAFSMFFFTGLAFAKRYAELIRLENREGGQAPGRGYQVSDIDIIKVVGPGNGLIAVMVLALYIHSPEVRVLYKTPEFLWMICPLLLYWNTRIWFLAARKVLDEDPVVFAIKDRVSYAVGVLAAVCLLAAK